MSGNEPVFPKRKGTEKKIGKIAYGDLLIFEFEVLENKKKKGGKKDDK